MRIPVIVCRTYVHEGGVMAEGEKSKPYPIEDIYHSGDAGELAERNDALSRLVDHLLIVNKTNFLLQARVQQGHIIRLGLEWNSSQYLVNTLSKCWSFILKYHFDIL